MTANDYKALINERFGNIVQDLQVFGGQDKDPPEFGKVFISIKPKGDEDVLTSLQKEQITNYLKNKKILAIDTKIIDSDLTFIFFNLFVKYDDNKTNLSPGQIVSKVQTSVDNFNNSFEEFNNNFRYSTFLKEVDASDTSILNSLAQVFCYKKFLISRLNTQIENVKFRFSLLGEVDQEKSMISTTRWTFTGNEYELEDEAILNDTSKRKLRLVKIGLNNERIKTDFAAGFLFPSLGLLQINPLPTNVDSTIEITTTPSSYNISSSENNILTIDSDKTTITATDSQIATPDNII